jgi:hypothetical protein
MAAKIKSDIEFVPVVPIDDETSSMLAYAANPIGRARIEKARQELREAQGISIGPGYFSELYGSDIEARCPKALNPSMRRITFAPSFDQELVDITVRIESGGATIRR